MLSVIQSDINSNSSKILRMSSLPAIFKRIVSIATEKRWRHLSEGTGVYTIFLHHKSMRIFQTLKGS